MQEMEMATLQVSLSANSYKADTSLSVLISCDFVLGQNRKL